MRPDLRSESGISLFYKDGTNLSDLMDWNSSVHAIVIAFAYHESVIFTQADPAAIASNCR